MMSAFAQWRILLDMELKALRQNWYWSLGMSSLYPLSLLCLLKFNSHQSSWPGALYAISGSMVFAVVLNTTLGLGQELSALRESSSFDFYATLPITKAQLVLAILARSVVLALPSVLIVMGIGRWALGINHGASPLIIPVLLLSCLTLAGLGAVLGFYAPSARFANFATQAIYILIAFFSPVMFPEQGLPPALRIFSRLLPTTYAASVLRQLISGGRLGAAFLQDLGALAAFALLSLCLLTRRMEWRAEN